jgi:protein phosphatase
MLPSRPSPRIQEPSLPVSPQTTPLDAPRLDLGDAFGLTDIGTVRGANEDKLLIEPELGLLAVADGMGGHAGGQLASASALAALAHYLRAAGSADSRGPLANFRASAFDPAQTDPDATWTDDAMRTMVVLHDAVEYANQQVYQANVANRRGDGTGMGTTLTGLWQPVPGGPAFVFHVGDSRLYRWRDGRLEQVTRDQTMYQQALDAGVRRNLPARNLLLQALGPCPEVRPELMRFAIAPGDLYLLCSDGLHGASDDRRIASVLARHWPVPLDACCHALVEGAKQDGSRDNITVVLVRCLG